MKASSTSRRITRGDAEAVLNAFGGGGQAVLLHSKTAEGAPADFLGSHGSIRPFSGSPWDGAHFCAEDWHVILIADIEGGDASFKHNDAARIMDGLNVSFTLDGASLPTTRTAVKRFLNPEEFGLQVAYYFQQGQIMSPADLSVGSHRGMVKSCGRRVLIDHAATLVPASSGRSMRTPFSNLAPARTRATRCGPLT
jgi:hypothetical protein